MLVAAVYGCGGQEAMRSDWEIQNAAQLAKEGESAAPVALPRYPSPASLVEFRVDGFPGYRLFVDSGTLSVEDGIVRYALVARSAAGAENVTYEGLNCRSSELRVYAIGRADGRWSPQPALWRTIGQRPVQRALMRDFLCPQRTAIASREEGVMALRRGGHPRAEVDNPVSGSR
jgi:hypothetical protein